MQTDFIGLYGPSSLDLLGKREVRPKFYLVVIYRLLGTLVQLRTAGESKIGY